MIKFKFENKSVVAPNCWEEVTVGHFINPYFLSGDSVSLLSSLSGIERNKLLNTVEDIEGPLNRMVKFIQEDPEGFKGEFTNEFEFRGKKLKVPLNIEVERMGQKIMLQDAMVKHQSSIYEAIPDAVAIYLQPEINDGVFDDSQLEGMKEEILELKIADVFPIASFFLTKFNTIAKSGLPS